MITFLSMNPLYVDMIVTGEVLSSFSNFFLSFSLSFSFTLSLQAHLLTCLDDNEYKIPLVFILSREIILYIKYLFIQTHIHFFTQNIQQNHKIETNI